MSGEQGQVDPVLEEVEGRQRRVSCGDSGLSSHMHPAIMATKISTYT